MKKQQFQTWENFKSEDWIPTEKEQYCSFSTETISARFNYDFDSREYGGRILQEIKYPPYIDNCRQYMDNFDGIIKQLKAWGLDPFRVTWLYTPNRFQLDSKFSSFLRETLDPQPSMFYVTCEDDENCFVDSKYYILNEGYQVELHWNQYIYNDNTKPINLWNKFLELLKQRVKEPFRVRLSTPDEDEQERENEG